MSECRLGDRVRRVLYHHRTQGKAVEGVHIRGITDALRAAGVAVDIISVPGADPYSTPKSMSPTQQATRLMKAATRLPEPVFELAELAYNALAMWRVWRHLRRHRDVDFIYERYSLFMFSTVLLGRLRRLPVILEVNDSATVVRVRPLCFRRLAMAIERWTFRQASGLVFVSSLFRDRALAAHGALAPTIVTPNAANIEQFSVTPQQREATRRQWGLDGHVVCGYLGAFVPWHAIDQFVFRIADMMAAAPHLKLLLVGDGATFPVVQQFVQERGLSSRVVLAGRVPHDQVPGLLAAMDMAILPSAGDYTSPVKLFEFMACGVPPLAPDFAPIREVLEQDRTGWMFKAGDLQAAANQLVERSLAPERMKAVGQAARDYITRERQWHHNVTQLVEFFERLTGRARA
jgi:glycosyltransferase involved in cell wall biosynthesis